MVSKLFVRSFLIGLLLSGASSLIGVPASAAPILTVQDPLIDKLPNDRTESIALTKWVQVAQEKGLASTKKVEVKSRETKTTDKQPQFVVISALVVNFAPIQAGATREEIEAANKAFKINVNMKLVDLTTGKIANSASTLFRGNEWKGWPTAQELAKPKFIEEGFGHELLECIQDGCTDLLSKLPDGNAPTQ